jgi:hypothetical protein
VTDRIDSSHSLHVGGPRIIDDKRRAGVVKNAKISVGNRTNSVHHIVFFLRNKCHHAEKRKLKHNSTPLRVVPRCSLGRTKATHIRHEQSLGKSKKHRNGASEQIQLLKKKKKYIYI